MNTAYVYYIHVHCHVKPDIEAQDEAVMETDRLYVTGGIHILPMRSLPHV